MNKEKSQIIGIILLSLIFVTYFQYFGGKTSKPQPKPKTEVTIKENLITKIKRLMPAPPLKEEQNAKPLIVENEDVRIWLNKKGGMVTRVVLKKHKGSKQEPLTLLQSSNSYMQWTLSTESGIINTKDLDCKVEVQNNAISFTYTLDSQKEKQVKYTYTLPKKGYVLSCKVDVTGFNPHTDNALFEWYHAPENLERDFRLNSNNTYVQYQSQNKGLKYLNKDKKATLGNIQWGAIKQRFFTSAIIAPKDTVFTHGSFMTQSAPIKYKNTLMEVGMQLNMPLDGKTHSFSYYFGPNIYNTLSKVAPGFENNHYLGFTLPKYINKYIISPLADTLYNYTNNYLWVLLLLALFFMLLRLYPAYKDYIFTLKQKFLKDAFAKVKSTYTDKQQAKLEEINFYTKMGLPPSSFLIKIVLMLTEIPVFMAMIYFIPNNIALRNLPFLWTNDLSSADHLISLPFSIPLLGNYINLFALLMCLSFLIRSRRSGHQETTEQSGKAFKYILPVAMFLGLNRYASAFCLYRIFTDILNLVPPLIFKLLVNKEFHLAKLGEKSKNTPIEPSSQKLPRTLARLSKKGKT